MRKNEYTMDCRRFEENLERLLTGELSAEESDRAKAHGTSCARCAHLLDIVHGDPHVHELPNEESFVAALLQKTVGSGCARAEANLCAWIDGELDETETSLVRMHVEHCPGCNAVTAALRTLAADLAGMLEIDPGPAFTRDVLARTRAADHSPAVTLAARLRDQWQRFLLRPRAAMELATAGSFVLVLLCGLPFSPLREMPRQALQVAQLNPVAIAGSSTKRLQPLWADFGAPVWARSGARLIDSIDATAKRLNASRPWTTEQWNNMSAHASDAVQAAWKRDGGQLSRAVRALGNDFESLRNSSQSAPEDSIQAGPQPQEE